MPVNKNALIRYNTIDRCLRNNFRKWTLNDLVEAVSDALYDMEGITKGVSVRTVQADIQMMRSDKLGYWAPIEVYDGKYYRYSDPEYSINHSPLPESAYRYVTEAINLIDPADPMKNITELQNVLTLVKKELSTLLKCG